MDDEDGTEESAFDNTVGVPVDDELEDVKVFEILVRVVFNKLEDMLEDDDEMVDEA